MIELVLRACGLGTPIVYDSVGAAYAPHPNQRTRRFHGAWVTVDSAGLRGTQDWHNPADLHVLFLGDSVTWGGTSIDDHDLFSEVACRRLATALNRRSVCGDGGVDAYGIDNMRARLGRIDGADAVVVTLLPGDAIHGSTDFKGLPFFSRRPWGPLKATWELAAVETFHLAEILLRKPHWQDMGDLAIADQALDRLFASLHEQVEKGRVVLVVYSPMQGDVPEQPFSTHVRERMHQSGLPFLDMTAPMLAASGPLYLDGTHLTEAGHKLYGEAIAKRLTELCAGR